jgi:hypothetical protein
MHRATANPTDKTKDLQDGALLRERLVAKSCSNSRLWVAPPTMPIWPSKHFA